MPWVSAGTRVELATDEQQSQRAKITVTKDGTVCAQDVWIRSPLSLVFPPSLAVTGTFWPATQPVSIAASVAVTGAFFQSTQPVSAAALPLPAGASTEATLALIKAKTDNLDVALSTRAVTGLTDAQLRASAVPMSASSLPLPAGAATEATLGSLLSAAKPATLVLSRTAAVNTALTVTLPAAGAGLFHYIVALQVTKLYSVIGVAAGAGVIVTTTNLPDSLAFTTEQLALAAGNAVRVVDLNFTGNPLKCSVVNTATTVVCPQQLQTIWRINVMYYTGT